MYPECTYEYIRGLYLQQAKKSRKDRAILTLSICAFVHTREQPAK